VLEGLACETPTVATAGGGIVEQIVDGETGLLVPGGDPGILAGRITDILRDRTLHDRLSAGGARAARARCHLRLQVDAYLRWYTALADPDPDRSRYDTNG
jgi:glycosyltransferase involved in cell wall biosynthesis